MTVKNVRWGEALLEKYAANQEPGMGIPDPADYGIIETLPVGQEYPFVVQYHKAKRAGPHYDVRLGKDRMFSWATKKGLPEPGERRQLFQTPLHEEDYMHYEGPLKGYGAGTVSTADKGGVLVTSVQPGKISFVTTHTGQPKRYTLIRSRNNPKTWLAVNTTPTSVEEWFGKNIPPGSRVADALGFKKVPYKQVEPSDISKLYDPDATFSEKIDGAAALYKLMKDRIEAVSYRVSKKGHPIVHTERLMLPKGLNIPPHLVGSVLRGEIWGQRTPDANVKISSVLFGKAAQEAIPPQELGGILNASLAKALAKQRQERIRLKNALFDIYFYGGKRVDPSVVPYKQRVEMVREILKVLPEDKFHLPQMATEPSQQKKLWEDIKTGRNPRTREGVVVWNSAGQPIKVKIRPEYDVYITGTFPGEGKYADRGVGGITYATEPGGKTVGKVGTGLTDELREELYRQTQDYIGRRARIKAQEQFPSGAYRAPSLIAIHEDYPAVQ